MSGDCRSAAIIKGGLKKTRDYTLNTKQDDDSSLISDLWSFYTSPSSADHMVIMRAITEVLLYVLRISRQLYDSC